MSRFPGSIPHPSQGPSGERLATARRRRNPPGNAQANERRRPDGLWRAASQGAHRRGAVPAQPAPDLSGHRTEGRRVVEARRLFFGRYACGSRMGLAHTALRHACRRRRPHGRFRRLGHAGRLRLADRGAPRGAPRRRHVRRLAHVRRRPARRPRARVPAAAARERRRQAHASPARRSTRACCARPAA